MKKLIAFVLVFVCALWSFGCQPAETQNPADETPKTETTETTKTPEVLDTLELEAVISGTFVNDSHAIYDGALNTDLMRLNSVQHIPIYKFNSFADFEAFKLKYVEKTAANDDVPTFEETVAAYDEAFFEENGLVLVYFSANSGSFRYGVDSIICEDGDFRVHVQRLNDPEEFTDDMAHWFVTIPVPNGVLDGCTEFDAVLN